MGEAERKKMFDSYKKNRSFQVREKLIIEYAPLVKIVAGRLSMYLGHLVEYDDLVGYGVFGLIDAIEKFDSDKMVKFETYASLRIRGTILDQVRKMDWIPRTVRQKQKKIDLAVKKIEAEQGRVATDTEIAIEIGIKTEDLEEWYNQMKVTNLVSLEEFLEQKSEIPYSSTGKPVFEQPEKTVEDEEIKRVLMDSFQILTDREKKVILLYYYEELTLKEISKVLEVSESRVSQLHTKAIFKLRQKLGDYFEVLINS